MLKKLSIKNIALISDLSIELDKGLLVFSGETGAGKSLIIDSISLMLGLRADKSLITTGEDYASVTAVFEISSNPESLDYLRDIGVDVDDTVIINRKIFASGKNECRVNGFPFTLSMLKGFTSKIMDLHGQFEHQSLLKPSNHIKILDSYNAEKLFDTKQKLQKEYLLWQNILSELKEFSGTDEERAREIDLLTYQIDEIESASVKEGESEELKEKRLKIINAEKVLSSIKSSIDNLDGSTFGDVVASISASISAMSVASGFDDKIAEQQNRLTNLKYELADILDELNSSKEEFVFDSSEADMIEERLDQIKLLHKKYGSTVADIEEYLVGAQNRLKKLTSSTETINNLNKQKKEIEKTLLLTQSELSSKRKEIAAEFEKAVLGELSDLGMSSSHFVVNIDQNTDHIGTNGFDTVEFFISTNIGEPVKPLSKIISGGEMSRFMLALKNITAKLENINTMIFDEIDTGISGKMGKKVAEKLAAISHDFQVICVSHLPQIVAMADSNYLITKSEKGGKTHTFVKTLDDQGKISEVARLAGGESTSDISLSHAKELVDNCNNFKNKI